MDEDAMSIVAESEEVKQSSYRKSSPRQVITRSGKPGAPNKIYQ